MITNYVKSNQISIQQLKISCFLFFLTFLIVVCAYAGSQNSDLDIIHQKVVNELLVDQVSDNVITSILEDITIEGNWPDIDYVDTSRTGFQHGNHLSRMVALSKAYHQYTSKYHHNPEIKQALSKSLNFWLAHDFMCANWWWNQIGTPRSLVAVLLLMQDELSDDQIAQTIKIIDRANLDASGARPSGDRIKIAGILAKKLLVLGDQEEFNKVIKVIEEEIKFSEGRGMQVDYSFHHRVDRVNNTLSYGLGYAQAFAEWAAYVSGTRYQFSDSSIHQLVDYYLDGICKMMAYGTYPDPGAKNRSVSRAGTLKAFGIKTIDQLLSASDYRTKELNAIRSTRLGEQPDHRAYNKFFWQSEYMSHQRPEYFTSARMYSTRNQNMEYPYNSEGLKNHYLGDGANFISRTGQEYYDIFPELDWRRIPGTTVVQKPYMPSEEEVREEGVTEFVGGVSDGLMGVSAFDYMKKRDSLQARKSWFFFDDVYVCLGAGISSESEFAVNTTINQSLLREQVFVSDKMQNYSIKPESENNLENILWVWHDSVGYVFPTPQKILLSNQTQTGSWYDINRQSDTPIDVLHRSIFKLWLNHGIQPKDGHYSYIVVPSVSLTEIENRDFTDIVKIISNSSQLQAVQNRMRGVVQAVFYEKGTLTISAGLSVKMMDPGMIMIAYRNGQVKSITASDPTRTLGELRFAISQELIVDSKDKNVVTSWDSSKEETSISVRLPLKKWAGSSVTIDF